MMPVLDPFCADGIADVRHPASKLHENEISAPHLQQITSLWCSWLSRSAVNVTFIYRKVTGSIPVEEMNS